MLSVETISWICQRGDLVYFLHFGRPWRLTGALFSTRGRGSSEWSHVYREKDITA